jgi:Transcriptional regulator
VRRPTLDLEALRTLVTGVQLDSFAKAAIQLNRSTSAVSAQLKKLEAQTGHPLLVKSGRGLILTPFGERLLTYAQKMLMINDEAFVSFAEYEMTGKVSIGLQEDFGERLLSGALATFSRAFPNIEIEIQVARNKDLLDGVRTGKLDLAWVWTDGSVASKWHEVIAQFPMRWIVSKQTQFPLPPPQTSALPLIMFERTCLFREAAICQLDQNQIHWRQVMSSHSLAGIWSAVSAGLGMTVRTEVGMPDDLISIDHELPSLPDLTLCALSSQVTPSEAALALNKVLKESLFELYPNSSKIR